MDWETVDLKFGDLEKPNSLTEIDTSASSCKDIEDKLECKTGALIKSSLKLFLLNFCLKKVKVTFIVEIKLQFSLWGEKQISCPFYDLELFYCGFLFWTAEILGTDLALLT